MRPRFWLIGLAILTLIRLAVAAIIPLAPDEAYYWLWSRHLQAGYFDDAPLIAWWIRAGTSLFGTGTLGIRLLSPIGAALGSILLWRAGEDLFPGRTTGLRAAILLNATLLLNAGAVITTPDTPLLLFWTATLAAVARWHATGNDRWWLAAGLAAGLALDAKYTGLLILVAIGLWLLSGPHGRAALRRPWPWIGVAVAIATFAPVIGWNAAHGWASFLKQGGRTTHFDLNAAPMHLAGLIGGQIGLVTPGIILLMSLGVWRVLRDRSAPARLVSLSVLVPGLVFLEHVLSGPVQPNWPAILMPGAALAAAAMEGPQLRRGFAPAIALGGAMSLLVYVQAVAAPLELPVRRDPIARQLAGWHRLASDVKRIARRRHVGTILAGEYGLVGEIAHQPGVAAVAGIGGRWQYFTRPRLAPATSAILIQPAYLPEPSPDRYRAITSLGTVRRTDRGVTLDTYHLYEVVPTGHAPTAILRARR